MRPVHAGMCPMAALKDGSLDLCDFALMNDYLDMRADNEAIIDEWRDKE